MVSRRRALLTLGATVTALAGCARNASDTEPTDSATRGTPTTSSTTPTADTTTDSETTTDVDPHDENTLYVSPDGRSGATGTRDDPFASIQDAVELTYPGQTVHLLPGRYTQMVHTVRNGKPDAPITISATPDAVFSGATEMQQYRRQTLLIEHSHIHVRGGTYNGLHTPEEPDRRESYADQGLIYVRPTPQNRGYESDIVIKPDRVGYSRTKLIYVGFAENVEIGEFEVIGPAGLDWLRFADELPADSDYHDGEIVYVGSPPNLRDSGPGANGRIDYTNNVHVHHIDNSAGYGHAELVNTKPGTHDVLVEFCTDGGGSQNRESYPSRSLGLQGTDATVRWNRLLGGQGAGVDIGHHSVEQLLEAEPNAREPLRNAGTNNAVYGNMIRGYDEGSFVYGRMRNEEPTGPEHQRVLCGNTVADDPPGNPERSCASDLPTADTIGHLGGASPWANE